LTARDSVIEAILFQSSHSHISISSLVRSPVSLEVACACWTFEPQESSLKPQVLMVYSHVSSLY
jgi:hypothetical protein